MKKIEFKKYIGKSIDTIDKFVDGKLIRVGSASLMKNGSEVSIRMKVNLKDLYRRGE